MPIHALLLISRQRNFYRSNVKLILLYVVIHMHTCVHSLTLTGAEVARNMYGSPDPRAWVGHGFTDGYMQPALYGDNQWALCVSCGAWAALHQFETYIYGAIDDNSGGRGGSDSGRELFGAINAFRGVVGSDGGSGSGSGSGRGSGDELLRVINTLRGVVLFFKHYMFRMDGDGGVDDYTVHTGPTTSPENSYILLHTGVSSSHAFISFYNT